MKHTKTFEELQKPFSDIYKWFNDIPDIPFSEFNTNKTVHIIVDMVNGFVKQGALASREVFEINDAVAEFAEKCNKKDIMTIALADSHTKQSPEFDIFPKHCICGTYESEITDEIKKATKYILVEKNSVNGFLEPEFQKIIHQNNDKNTFIITGDCTDMCVIQFALSLKSDFNRRNVKSRIVLPYELTATYGMDGHNAELSEIMALYIMNTNGIEIVKNIKF